MHAIHPDRRVLLAALVAFLFALMAAVAAPSLNEIELGGGSAPAASSSGRAEASEPVWATDPVAPPALLRDAR